jgi:hypothetical protein
LFTGERTPPHGLTVEPLHLEASGNGMDLKFSGPILHLDDGATYLDLEAAFAASTLGDIEANIRFTSCGVDANGAQFGRIAGLVDLNGERREISTRGYINAGIARAGQRQSYAMLAADFGSGGVLVNVAQGFGARIVEFQAGAARDISPAQLPALARDCDAPSRPIEVRLEDASVLRATPRARMEILRALGADRYARVTFGTAHFEWGDRRGHGIYEYARLVGRGEDIQG